MNYLKVFLILKLCFLGVFHLLRVINVLVRQILFGVNPKNQALSVNKGRGKRFRPARNQ